MLASVVPVSATAQLRVAVLPNIVDGPNGRASSREIFEPVASELEWRMELEEVSFNELFVDGIEPIARTLRACGSDAACLRSATADANVELVLDAIVDFNLAPPLVTISLVDGATGQATLSEIGELDGAPLAATLAKLTRVVLDRGRFVFAGTLDVAATPADAKVRVVGAEVRTQSSERVSFRLPAGEHNIRIESPGHEPSVRSVQVIAGEAQAIDVVLLPIPPPDVSLVERPWFWVAVGAVAIGAATAVVVASTSNEARCGCITTVGGACGLCP